MAGHAGLGDGRVVNCRANPASGNVTSITGRSCRNVCHRFADGNHSIVTAFAGADDFPVIHDGYRYPHRCAVTGFTQITSTDMGAGFAGGKRAFMTGHTGLSERGVIDGRTDPGCRNVTGLAGGGSGNMCCPHTRGDDAIMT